jgi:Fic family protein
VQTAQRLLTLFREDTERTQTIERAATSALRVFGVLHERPLVTLNQVQHLTGVSFQTATKGMNALVELGIVRELTGQRRNRVFAYDRYLSILNEGIEPL